MCDWIGDALAPRNLLDAAAEGARAGAVTMRNCSPAVWQSTAPCVVAGRLAAGSGGLGGGGDCAGGGGGGRW